MSTTIADVMSSLEQLLLDHFKAINTGSSTQPFLAFELGTPMPDEIFRNPADMARYSPALALEYLSHRSNAVPSIQQRLFVETGKTVDGLYEILLQGSTPLDPGSMELLGSIRNRALAAFEDVVQAEEGISEPFRPTHGDPENWYDQSVNGNWTNVSVSRADQPNSPPVHPVLFDQRLLRWNLAAPEVRLQLGEAVSPAFKTEIASRRLAAASLPGRHVAPGVLKNAPASELLMTATPKAITPLLAARVPLEHTLSGVNNKFRRPMGERTRPLAVDPSGALVPGMPAPVPPPPPQPPVSSDAFSITVGISIVKVRRPWLSDGLLNLTNWFVPHTAKGSFSGGTGPDDSGILPVLPVACVLIRNLSIRAQWSEDDQKNVESSTHLGAFGLQGRTYDRNTATLTVPGMQSVAWICDPLPVLPPADPPAS